MIFSKNRRKLDPKRRFGSREFRTRIKAAQNYKRLFNPNPRGFLSRILGSIGFRSKWMRFLAGGVIIILFYFLVISAYFRISDVTVTGNNQVSREQVKEVIDRAGNSRILLIPKNHFLLLTRGSLNRLFKKEIPSIKEVKSSNRTLPNKIEIEIVERSPGFVLKSKEVYYLVDEDGITVKQLEKEIAELPLVINQLDENIALNEAFNTKMVVFILSMHRQWPTKINSQVRSILIPGKAASEVIFDSSEGWTVFFDINRSVLSQIGSLSVLLSKQIKPQDRSRLAYIDLRLAKWAYYCFKNTPCNATPQEELEAEIK